MLWTEVELMKNKKRSPLISVVMPVYNAGDFLVESINSILRQTYQNIELVIVDDASTDHSWKILESFAKKDKRIKLFRNRKNMGVSLTVKKAISKAKGQFLARMDADDIARSSRLKKQVDYLFSHPEVVAVGGQCQVIDIKRKIIGEKKFPIEFKDIYKSIFTFIPIQQPTLMVNRSKLPKDFQYYQDGMNTAEEVELLFKLFQYGRVENLPEYLLQYRLHGNNTSLKNLRLTFLLTLLSRVKAIFQYDYKPTFLGVISTLIQTGLVLLLPQNITLWLYKKIKHLTASQKDKSSIKSIRLGVLARLG